MCEATETKYANDLSVNELMDMLVQVVFIAIGEMNNDISTGTTHEFAGGVVPQPVALIAARPLPAKPYAAPPQDALSLA